jgi:CubicO group peptidase (beta-lactamase class C family)
MNADQRAGMSARADAWRDDNRVPGVVAGVVDDQQLSWSCALGVADALSGEPMTADRLFRIGSITKTFVATAILQLRDEGKLNLEDALVRHLPAAEKMRSAFGPIDRVTLRDLLQHTAGMPRELPVRRVDEPIARSDGDFIAAIPEMELVRAPGEAHQYSNVGYRLLGFVVERVSNRTFADYVGSELLAPLGMAETAVSPTGALANRLAVGHWAREADGDAVLHASVDPRATGGEGALHSTLRDLGLWVSQQLRTDPTLVRGEGQVLHGSTLADAHRPLVLANTEWTTAWGLGWSTVRKAGTCQFHGHNGSMAGYQAYAGFCTEHRHGAIVLTNGHTTVRPAVDLCGELLALSRRDATDVSADALVRGDDAWAPLLGEYVWPQLAARVHIVIRRGRLICRDSTDGYELKPIADGKDTFRLREGPQTGELVRFLRAHDGAIEAVNVAGYTYQRSTGGTPE